MQPELTPNLSPYQGHATHEKIAVPQRVETRQRVQPSQPVVRQTPPAVKHAKSYVRNDRSERNRDKMPGYFQRDVNYYGHYERPNVIIYPYADVDTNFTVPDGYEVIMVNGETFYYYQGSFFQQVGDQLVAIPAVLGAVVDSIPEDYQIILADGCIIFLQGVFIING